MKAKAMPSMCACGVGLTGLLALGFGCTTTPEPNPPDTSHAEWTVYTHAVCNGARVDNQLDLCVPRSSLDAAQPGDNAARQWSDLWRGACEADQGLIGTAQEGQLCVYPGTVQPANWGCSVNLVFKWTGC